MQNSFPYEWFRTYTRFEKEAQETTKWPIEWSEGGEGKCEAFLYTTVTHYKLVKEPLHRNEAVSKLLAEERNGRARELGCNHKMTDLHKHIHGVTVTQ